MDLLNQLMDTKKPFKKIYVPTGQVDGVMNVNLDDTQDQCEVFALNQSVNNSTYYAEEYQRQEEALYSENCKDEPADEDMSQVDHASDMLSLGRRLDVEDLKFDQARATFLKYNFNKFKSQGLPIDKHKETIVNLINVNGVVIIQGATGCGKTTQVPQFILDDYHNNNKPCRIVVTQPRRIAAISVARRVCEERSWSVGTVCGYQVGLERELNNETILSYVTTGVLLQKLIKQKNLHEYTHIIVDEVHERNQDMDFLLLIVRKFLNTNSPNTKVILMSATFNTQEFSLYFKTYSKDSFIPAPVLEVSPTGNKYNTQIFYGNQLGKIGEIPYCDPNEPKIDLKLYDIFVKLIRAFERLDHIDPTTNEIKIGHVLVFLPGILEIEEAHNRLTKYMSTDPTARWRIIPLHSSITIEEQRKVFDYPPTGERKIILSTNIAESSITVPDISYVVDFCLTKTMIVDPDTQYQSLQLQWASHVNCIQRAGRVGRVSDGRVYRLVTKDFYDDFLPTKIDPEIKRAPIHQVVLKAKLLDLNQPPKAIIGLAMNPPEESKIDSSVLFLKEIGALTINCNGRKSVTDGDITFMGKVMAALPLDVHLSKLIVLGHMFSCLNECVIMATGCSLNVFKSPFKERHKAYSNRLLWADGSASDLIAHLNLYRVWQNKKRSKNAKMELEFCRINYVSQRTLREWALLVREVQDRLSKFHIRPSEGPARTSLSYIQLPIVVVCGAFYPYYFKRSADGGKDYEREAVKLLGGRDPYDTLYFTGFDPQQPGPLYTRHVKEYLKDCSTNVDVTFDSSSKLYVTFKNSHQMEIMKIDGREYNANMPGNIRTEVYKALKLKQLNVPLCFKVLSREKAWKMAKEYGLSDKTQLPINEIKTDPEPVVHFPVLPPLDVQNVHIRICEQIDCGHFWAHNVGPETESTLYEITVALNSKELVKAQPDDVEVDSLYAARYSSDNTFYRCKVLAKIPFGKDQSVCAQVIFIDYGSIQQATLDQLYQLPDIEAMSKPPQAMECVLSEIQPSAVFNPRALWSDKATMIFKKTTENRSFYGKVFSVVHNVVHLELYPNPTNPAFENSLNHWLIEQGYAQPAEESFLSKENHQKRQQLVEDPQNLAAFLREENISKNVHIKDIEPPSQSLCNSTLLLKGPFSPLEMTIHSLNASGSSKRISVETNSVNSVLLDTDPQETHDRLIVAAHIGQNVTGTALSLRHTTIMPNIHGFPMLMSLLFCPIMETKPTEDGSRFAAVLCGLGPTEENSNRAIYAPHDICLTLDTDLTDDDINKTNTLRYWMNMAIVAMNYMLEELPSSTTMESCQLELKGRLFELLKEQRKSVEKTFIPSACVWGKCLYNAELLKPGDSFITSEIWPLHSSMRLNRQLQSQISLKERINELQELMLNMKKPSSNIITCPLCKEEATSAAAMRIHMTSKGHLDKVKKAMESENTENKQV